MKTTEVYLNPEFIEPFYPMIQAMENVFSKTLQKYFDKEDTELILSLARGHFNQARNILPNVGPRSPWLKNMIGITYEIGLWKELFKRKIPLNKISILTQETLSEISKKSIPSKNKGKIGRMLCSFEYTKQISDYSHQKEYPDDWVFDYILPGANDNFQIGMNIHKCPVGLLCERLEAKCFFPYLCLNDYVTHSMLGISLSRTQTIAHGAAFCDFRLSYTGKIFPAIVKDPTQTEEFKNRNHDKS